jgi:hypothetical protein
MIAAALVSKVRWERWAIVYGRRGGGSLGSFIDDTLCAIRSQSASEELFGEKSPHFWITGR